MRKLLLAASVAATLSTSTQAQDFPSGKAVLSYDEPKNELCYSHKGQSECIGPRTITLSNGETVQLEFEDAAKLRTEAIRKMFDLDRNGVVLESEIDFIFRIMKDAQKLLPHSSQPFVPDNNVKTLKNITEAKAREIYEQGDMNDLKPIFE